MDRSTNQPIVDNGVKPKTPAPGPKVDREVEPHDPALYTAVQTAQPLDGFDAIGDEQVAAFKRNGFLAVEHAFTKRETDDARAGLLDLIEGRNPSFTNLMFEGWSKDQVDNMTAEQRVAAVRKLFNFTDYDERLKALLNHPRLLSVVERLIGARPTLIQEMALVKMPHGREKPWHQDRAYFDVAPESPVVGVWIALDEATIANGCMHVMTGEHRDPIVHFQRRDWQICDTQMLGRDCTAVPLKPGGVLLFDSLLPHGTPTNGTDMPRRAVQFHYAAADAAEITRDQRMAVFGSEGKDVYC